MRPLNRKRLVTLVLMYMTASLIHFIHNAEFLSDYPNLPMSWTRAGVYFAWLGMTAIGATGLFLAMSDRRLWGLLIIAVYSVLGLDSLGHYLVAPFSAHTATMNLTILLEVSTAALLFIEAIRLII